MVQEEDKRRREKGLKDEMLEVLREKNAELRKANTSLQSALTRTENDRLRQTARAQKAEEDREALYDAVRVLSASMPNTTSQGRKARHDARKLLEQNKIPPPSTLGSSRQVESRKKKRRKRS